MAWGRGYVQSPSFVSYLVSDTTIHSLYPSLTSLVLPFLADTAIHYDAKTIEALLDREQEGQDSAEAPGSENLLANEYLSSFKVASYVTKEVDDEVRVYVSMHDRF